MITGLVRPNEWDDDHVVGIEISTEQNENYNVELDSVGRDLLRLLDKKIVARGFVNKYRDGTFRIILDDYEILEDR